MTKRKQRRARRSWPPRRKKPAARAARGQAARAAAPARPARHSLSAPGPAGAAPAEESKGKRGYVYRDVRVLMRAVFRKNNPVDVATKLLNQAGDASKTKVFVQCLEYLYGKPVQHVEARGPDGEKVTFQFITTVPRPQYPNRFSSTNSSGAPLPAAVVAERAEGSDTREENDHE